MRTLHPALGRPGCQGSARKRFTHTALGKVHEGDSVLLSSALPQPGCQLCSRWRDPAPPFAMTPPFGWSFLGHLRDQVARLSLAPEGVSIGTLFAESLGWSAFWRLQVLRVEKQLFQTHGGRLPEEVASTHKTSKMSIRQRWASGPCIGTVGWASFQSALITSSSPKFGALLRASTVTGISSEDFPSQRAASRL